MLIRLATDLMLTTGVLHVNTGELTENYFPSRGPGLMVLYPRALLTSQW